MNRLALVLLLAGASAADAQVRGRVVDARAGEPIAGAMVRLSGGGSDRVIETRSDGSYVFPVVPAGDYRLRVVYAGYDSASVRIRLRPATEVVVDVPLVVRPVPVRPILVTADRKAPAPEPTDSIPRPVVLVRPVVPAPPTASALAGLVAADVAREPPDRDGRRRAHALYVWGSSAERGRVLLDGAALGAPLHMGGILPPVDPDLLAGAEIRTGGSSPRYDGGTTYVMEFATRPAQAGAVSARGELDMLSSRLGLEAALGQAGSVMVGARRVNPELIRTLLDRPFGYAYADALIRADRALGDDARLHATAVATREAIRVPRDRGEDEASWQNLAAAVAWLDRGGEERRSVQASFSRGLADLPLLSARGGHLEATVDRLATVAERGWRAGPLGGHAGLELEHLRFRRRSRADADPSVAPGAGPAECTATLPCIAVSATTVAAFGEASWQPHVAIAARAGVRAAYRQADGVLDVLPRAAASAVLGRSFAVTLSAGRFSQPFAAVPAAPDTGPVVASEQDQTATVAVAHATQLELNVVHRTARTRLAATAFTRHAEAGAAAGGPAAGAHGLDVAWTYIAADLLAGLGYSLTRPTGAADFGIDARTRHLVSASLAATRGRVRLDVSAAYGRGLPFTSLVLEDPSAPETTELLATTSRSEGAAGPDRDYLRLDAAIGAEWRFRHRGREVSVMPYAKLINALSRRGALFYYHDGRADREPRPLATVPAVPLLGIRWIF